MTKTHFTKQNLGKYLESNCNRQLFLNLGRDDGNWIQPLREVETLDRARYSALIQEIGKEYEDKVYNTIIRNNKNRVILHPEFDEEQIKNIHLTPVFLERVYQTFIQDGTNQELCFLEYNFETPEEFIRDIFQLKTSEPIPTTYSNSLRPDILIFGNKQLEAARFSKVTFQEKEPIRELLPEGSIQEVPEKELKSRIGISIIDVKLSRPDNIGKKYFFEILFYFLALSHYLRLHNLEDKFFVRVDGNGIFPNYDKIEDVQLTLDELRQRVVKMPFKDTYIIYDSLSNHLRELIDKIPCEIEDIPLNLQSICARCPYLEDCKKTLQCEECIPPEQWDLQLIPYASKTISEQLKDSNTPHYDTVKDVMDNIDDYPQKKVPTPLYAEKPFLKQRAKALIEKKPLKPKTEELFSIAIPKYSPISLIMDFETDPIHNVVLAVSFHLTSFLTTKWDQYDKFGKWWTLWTSYLEEDIDFEEVKREILEYFMDDENDEDDAIKFLKRFATALEYLISRRDNKRRSWYQLKHTSKSGKTTYHKIQLDFSMVNKDLNEGDEQEFSERVVSLLYALVIVIQNLEWFIKEGSNFLNSAIFYWSQEQIDYLEEFLERNLNYLNEDPELRRKTLYIFRWFNPSESNVKHPHHHKKFFNLRTFAETTMSFPLIINYTWHELAAHLSRDPKYNHIFWSGKLDFYEIYWNPHFNFIDFQQWYRYIKKNGSEKADLREEIKEQMVKKVRTLNKLRKVFQQHGKTFLVGYNKPKSMSEFLDYELSEEYHNIAQIWHLFENYTTAYKEFEVDRLRGMYPNYGVGKLESAKVNGIWQVPDTSSRYRNYSYEFELHGMSSNVKIGEGDWVICIPAILRDSPRYKNYQWIIVIDRMYWDNDHWEVQTESWSRNFLETYIDELENQFHYINDDALEMRIAEKIDYLTKQKEKLNETRDPILIDEIFYIYPRASNPWAKKLEKLLNESNYGDSWLGKVLAYKWGITTKKTLHYPDPFPYEGKLPEVYLYAPNLLPSFDTQPKDLMTTIEPEPDDSQKKAILNSLKYTVYGIQGPPGTGKTQTITALIDEYIHRQKEHGGVKVLVVAFSYAALRVVFNNLIYSRDEKDEPTEAAKANLLFLRSKNREPPQCKYSFFDVYNENKDTLKIKENIGKYDRSLGNVSIDTQKKLEDLLDMSNTSSIMFANAHQLVSLRDTYKNVFKFIHKSFAFDLIVVDESSQVPVNHLLSPLQFVKNFGIEVRSSRKGAAPNNEITEIKYLDDLYLVDKENGNRLDPVELTKLVIVGDQNQLPPVQEVKPPEKLEPILDNLFGYYADHHHIPNDQLQFNYRSHRDIVGFTNYMDIYEHEIKPLTNRDKMIDGDFDRLWDWIRKGKKPLIEKWVPEVLDREIAVESIIQPKKFETAVSPLEAHIVNQLVLGYYIMNMPKRRKVSGKEMKEFQQTFWTQKIGVVAPHNAQGRLIIRSLHHDLTTHGLNDLSERELMDLLKKTIYSVEKFQGSARDFIIASIGISAQDQLLNEEEFIYDLNRFNVLTSRARAKFMLICSQNFLTYIPDEKELMQTAAKIRRFALDYCENEKKLTVTFEGGKEMVQFRYHQ